MSPRPMLVVHDVEAASEWFQEVLGLKSAHGGTEYEMLMDDDQLVLQLHDWDADEHPHLGNPADPSRGNGVVIWFATDDFDGAVALAAGASAEVLDGPLLNPNSQQREIWLRGPDDYVVVVNGPYQG